MSDLGPVRSFRARRLNLMTFSVQKSVVATCKGHYTAPLCAQLFDLINRSVLEGEDVNSVCHLF